MFFCPSIRERGQTAGKRSPDGTYLEHEFNLDMAKRLKAQLERHGVSVTLTRSTEHDVTIQERADVSNAIGPDLFVSIHSNADGDGDGKEWTAPDGYGIYTSVRGEDAECNKAARAILARAKQAGIQMWGGGLFHDGDDGKRDMLDEDLISVSDGNPPLCTVRISSQTVRMLAGYEEKRRKDAQRKREQEAEREFERREKRKDRMLTAAISVISALFGSIPNSV